MNASLTNIIALLVLAYAIPSPLIAKGLEALTPSKAEDSPADDELNHVDDSTETDDSQEPQTEGSAVKSEEQKLVTQSRQSKALQDRLILTTGAGLSGFRGRKGDWQSDGSASIAVFWLTDWAWHSLPLQVALRYNPISVTANHDVHSYRGVAEGYHVGLTQPFALNKGLSAFAGLELGYVLVTLNQLDEVQKAEDIAQDEFLVSLRGGLSWQLLEKVTGGPVLAVGLGGAQSWQFGGNLSFTF